MHKEIFFPKNYDLLSSVKGSLCLSIHACQFENFLVNFDEIYENVMPYEYTLNEYSLICMISNINLWGWNAVTIITGTNRGLCCPDVTGTIPALWILKSSVSKSDKIPFGRPMSQVFPSHKNLMFLTTHTKTVILPMVGENRYRSETDINQPLRESNRRGRGRSLD